ncbi:MAG: DNA polymerase III subunit beta [Proteobacteria bacterium]|nr:DNA polymerase III subunit beta [Pseudomonadota bacterium]
MLNLRLKKDELLKGVSQTQSIAERRSSMPILSNVLLEAQDGSLAITATDLEISFKGTYEAEVVEQGLLTVPARKFYEIVRVLGDEALTLTESENNSLVITGSRSTYTLHGLSAEDFPPMPDYSEVNFMEIESDLLLDMIEKTIYSIATEETRYNLAGVYVEKADQNDQGLLRMVSTDGHRLSLVEKKVAGIGKLGLEKGVIISKKGVTEVRKLVEEGQGLQLGFTANSAVVKSERTVLVMRLLDGRFPDYSLVIPKKNDKIMHVGRKEFLEMLRRVSVMSSDDYKGVKFSLTPKDLSLIAVNPDLGEARESMPVEYEGEPLDIGFNPRYFIEALSALKGETVTVALRETEHPCLLTSTGDGGYQGVVMPMKI